MARGRPRQFNEDEALNNAIQLFLERGLSGTSLDDLAAAMNMNRPSIYNAFGNKDEIYRRALARFCGQLDHGLRETLQASTSLRDGLRAFFYQAIEVYCGTNPPLGCLMICTAPAEAVVHPEVGADLQGMIHRLDRAFAERLERAQREAELPEHFPTDHTAKLLQATLQTIALRARSGCSKRKLRELARHAVERLTVCTAVPGSPGSQSPGR